MVKGHLKAVGHKPVILNWRCLCSPEGIWRGGNRFWASQHGGGVLAPTGQRPQMPLHPRAYRAALHNKEVSSPEVKSDKGERSAINSQSGASLDNRSTVPTVQRPIQIDSGSPKLRGRPLRPAPTLTDTRHVTAEWSLMEVLHTCRQDPAILPKLCKHRV